MILNLTLMDNAIVSLDIALEHFFWICNNDPYYCKENSTRHLKQGILSISTSTELLIKIILSVERGSNKELLLS